MCIHCDNGLLRDMWDYFSFFAKDYRHMPKFKMGLWDGKIRLLNMQTHLMHSGLIHEVIRFAMENEYTIEVDPEFELKGANDPAWWCGVNEITDTFNLPFEPHDYQIRAVEMILKHRKRLVLSPTSSGKSFIIYTALRALLEDPARQNRRILLVVPTTSLVEQMVGDFAEYSANNDFDTDKMCHMIYSGKEKLNTMPVTVTTWQSVYKNPKAWFKNFDAVFVDEAHLASASSITKLMEKCVNAEYRVGLTGTIEDTQTHKLTLTGLFGRVYETITTKTLMDRGLVSQLSIKAIVFDHSKPEKKEAIQLKYVDEIDHIITDDRKNVFYAKLAMVQKGNTLVLFNFTDRHGKPLFELIDALSKGRKKVFYVDGDTPVEDREAVRAYAEEHNDVIIVASYGTFSTGINIKNLSSVIFAHPFKSKIKILQSIGRILRKGGSSDNATLYDCATDFRHSGKVNTTMKHFKDRLKLYEKAKFDYTIQVVNL